MTDRTTDPGTGHYLAMALLAATSCWPHMAFAQQSDSATIDATATLKKAPPVITLQPTDMLRFGTVQIHPVATGICGYFVGPDHQLTILEDGEIVQQSTKCLFLDNQQNAGRALVNCEAGLVVRFGLTASSASGDPAVVFNSDSSQIEADGVRTDSATCKDDGTIDVSLGGILGVLGSAQPIDSESVVGRLLLDVAYDDGTGCQYCQ